MNELPNCPKCGSEYTYESENMLICPECAYEWNLDLEEETSKEIIKDSNDNVLEDGDTIVVIKDLKVKGSSSPIKKGTRVKNIKLIYNSSDGHDISCRIDGFGSINLKSEFVKKN